MCAKHHPRQERIETSLCGRFDDNLVMEPAIRPHVANSQQPGHGDNHCMSIQTDDFMPGGRASAPRATAPKAASPDLARVVGGDVVSPQEDVIERALRPKDLDTYVGQTKAREQLE